MSMIGDSDYKKYKETILWFLAKEGGAVGDKWIG